MKAVVFFLGSAALTWASCTGPDHAREAPVEAAPTVAAGADVPPTDASTVVQQGDSTIVLHSLAGSGLRFDGYYDDQASPSLHYLMRFFPRGNVALIAGGQKTGDPMKLSDQLTENAKSGVNNLHNVPVTMRGDSIFFNTMASKGIISYAGTVLPGDSLRFLKVSRITGKQAIVEFAFRPDAPLK